MKTFTVQTIRSLAGSGSGVLLLMCCLLIGTTFNEVVAQKATIIDRSGNIVEEPGRSVHPDDSLALVALYHALDGPNWRNNSGWLQDQVEHWHGVEQVEEIEDDEWRITRFEIRSNRAVGIIPDDVEKLAYLERVQIDHNPIHGPFPIGFTKINTLQRLALEYGFLEGPHPWDELVAMPNLERLITRSNRLSGDISSAVGDFPRLERIEIYRNRLTGIIPPEFGQVNTITRLEIGENLLTGDIPETLGNLENLERIDLRQTYGLNPGPVPDFFLNHAETLTYLYLTGTNRTGEIPAWINQMFALERLYIGGGDDEIGGEIPDMTFLDNLYELRVEGENFTGPLPDFLAILPSLERLYFADASFSGTIPSNFGDGAFRRIYFSNLQLDGPMPDLRNLNLERLELNNIGFEIEEVTQWLELIPTLERITLADFGLTGDIPQWMGSLESLVRIDFSDNDLTGEIPDWVADLPDLERITLDRNPNMDITEIPSWMANRERLDAISLDSVGISGEIPLWIGDMPSLTSINLGNNNLTGAIPSNLGNLSFLTSLQLQNNNLSGEIPVGLADMGVFEGVSTFRRLDISGNPDLTGPVPIEFTNWDPDEMEIFLFDRTDLCEPDDPAFSDWLDKVAEPWFIYHPDPDNEVRRTGVICGQATSVDPVDNPYRFHLYSNYPNPFNPATTIKYELPSDAHVTLTVYNVLGQQVVTLVNEHRTTGQHEVSFDASRLSSGSYIYRLDDGNRTMTRTMMLIK